MTLKVHGKKMHWFMYFNDQNTQFPLLQTEPRKLYIQALVTKWHLSWLQRWLGYARWYFYLRLHLTKLFYHRYVSRQKCPKTSTATQNFSCNLNFLTWKILNNLIPISSFTYFYGNLHIYRFPNFSKSIQRKQVLLRSKVGNNLTQLKNPILAMKHCDWNF